MKLVAIIPARGGSKGIPNKNIVDICGLPMIAYTIKSALNSNIFHQVVVTTDNQDIKNTSLSYGACVIDRPSELAADNSSCLDAIEHALKYIISQDSSFTHFILLQPTSPLRNENHIIEAFKVYKSKNIGSLVSVNLNTTAPQKNLVEINGKIEPITTINDLTQNRQNLPKTYHPNGAIYISKIDDFLRDKNLFSDPLSIYVMDEESSTDIDNYDDLEKVKNILTNLNNQKDQFTSLISLIDKSLVSKINSKAYDKALEFYKTEDFTKAIDILSSLDRLSFDEISLIGVIYFKLQEFEKSKPFLEYCISQDPKKASKQSWLYYFNIIASQNDLEKCKDIIEQVIKYNKMDIRFAKTVCTKFQNSELYEELELLEYAYPFYEKNYNGKPNKVISDAYARFVDLKFNKLNFIEDNACIDDLEVLIPTYNRGDTIYKTIQAIKQYNRNIKIRIVDNASPDNTWENLNKAHNEFNNIFIQRNTSNMGYSYSMLRLLKESQAKYIIFTSDEDPVYPANLKKAIDFMRQNNIDYMSPIFIKNSQIYRGKSYIDEISPNSFGVSSAYTSALIFNRDFLLSHIDFLSKHIMIKHQAYPQVLMSMLCIIKGKSYWWNEPLAYMADSLKSDFSADVGDNKHNGVMERWRQFTIYFNFCCELEATANNSIEKSKALSIKQMLLQTSMQTLKNAARREFPQYKEYFI